VEDQNKVIAFFKEINFRLDKNNFEHRLIAQKMVYLLKQKGILFRYPYNLYVRGPYSPALASEYYSNPEDFIDLHSDATLEEDERTCIHNLDELFEKRASLLEIGATYAYLAYEHNVDPQRSFRIVKKMKSFYSNDQVVRGINKAKQFLFIPSPEDIRALDSELKMWQNASIRSMRH